MVPCTRLAKHDIVLTTYNIVGKEVGAPEGDKNGEEPIKDEDETDEKKVISHCPVQSISLPCLLLV